MHMCTRVNCSNWEGGIRVASFVSGGYLPPAVRGTVSDGLIAGWDWLSTFAGFAEEDPTDHKAAAAGLPPIDSIDMWPMLSGANSTSPRTYIEIGSNVGGDHGRTVGATSVGGIIVPPYKLILGTLCDYSHKTGACNPAQPQYLENYAGWTGPQSPNNTMPHPSFQSMNTTCGRTPETGCLFDVYADPTEHINIAMAHPDTFHALLAQVDELQKSVFSPVRGNNSGGQACAQAIENGDWWGPFVE